LEIIIDLPIGFPINNIISLSSVMVLLGHSGPPHYCNSICVRS